MFIEEIYRDLTIKVALLTPAAAAIADKIWFRLAIAFARVTAISFDVLNH
jgi:hypothetical protein